MTEKSKILKTPEGDLLSFSERGSVEIKLNISKDTMEMLGEIAGKRDLSVISLLKLFIGKGIRDLEPELAKEGAIKRFGSRKKFKNEKTEADLAA